MVFKMVIKNGDENENNYINGNDDDDGDIESGMSITSRREKSNTVANVGAQSNGDKNRNNNTNNCETPTILTILISSDTEKKNKKKHHHNEQMN